MSAKLFHCVERHEDANPAEAIRKRLAWDSWDIIYNAKGVIPCHSWEPFERDARSLGDKRPLPFLKDILKKGMDQAGDDDIIFWCNDDNILQPELADLLLFHCAVYDVCTSRRMEFRRTPFPKQYLTPEELALAGEHHIGRDIFAATKRWLVAHWDDLPDFVLGASDFDLCLGLMVRLYFGYDKTDRKSLFHDNIFPCELPVGYVSHIFHSPKWTAPNNIDAAPSQKHNRRLFRAWAEPRFPHLQWTANNCI